MVSASTLGGLEGSQWVGSDPESVPEFWPPEFDDCPQILRDLEPVRLLRTEFHLPARPVRAALSVTARGIYRVHINGVRVGDDELAPGWTDYRRRIYVRTFDITGMLDGGPSAIAAELADGWFAGYLGMDRRHQADRYGRHTALRARLHVDLGDGREFIVATGPGWHIGTGAARGADLLMGQVTDYRLEAAGWMMPGFSGHGFAPAWVDPTPDRDDPVMLENHRGPVVRRTETLVPVATDHRADGRIIVDFGVNLVGRVRLDLRGAAAGDRVHLRHAEACDALGEPYFSNLRTARAHDVVISAGGSEVFEPAFTLHGFRYAEVTGLPAMDPGAITASWVTSDVARLGTFECGHEGISALSAAIDRSIRGNLVSVPTDCPQRDERLGWLGDAQLITRTAGHRFDMVDFVRKWLVDIRDAQASSGAYPDVAPREVVTVDGAPGWADAGVLVPWTTWLMSGCADLIAEHRESMVRFMDHVEFNNPGYLRTNAVNRNYGDWLALDVTTPKALLATLYWKRCADAMAQMDAALDIDNKRWTTLSRYLSDNVLRTFVSSDGTVGSGSQTGYAMAIAGGVLPEGLRPAALRNLIADIRHRDGHLSTGIHGLRDLLPALSMGGRHDVAYDLLLQRDYPSWLYSIDRGATTVWERWDGWTEERGFQTPAMNSFNHYALGSVGQWMHEWVGGMAPDPLEPGFKAMHLNPAPDARLGWASARRETTDGPVECRWQLCDDSVQVDVVLPDGHHGSLQMPTTVAGSARAVSSDGVRIGVDRWRLRAGEHRFVATWGLPGGEH
jgi:alpha-L-rhamnosidase